jgi:SpoVK/Ycf46/Vps4 family AAA+-type ATPase
MLVNALANEYGLNLISIKGPELLSMPPDTIENNMHNIFDKARRSAPCILFIDDFDYICKYTNEE